MTAQQNALQGQGAPKEFKVEISLENSPSLDRAIESLEQLAETSPERVQLFLGGLDSLVELVRIDLDDCMAAGTGKIRALAKPTDGFLNFLAAAFASQR